MRHVLPLLLLAPGLAFASAPPKPGPPPHPETVTYACKDGTEMRVRIDAAGAHVRLPGEKQVLLPQQISGSGVRYATGQYELWGKGDDAMWTVGKNPMVMCRVKR